MKINGEIAQRVLDTVDAGLVNGLGQPVPGSMCVEAAVCYALGMPHSDRPACVGDAVREFKITLNDAGWSSPQARAAGMRRVAVAQLGSDEIDQVAFVKYVAEQTIRRIVPLAMRAAAKVVAPEFVESLEMGAVRCEQEGTPEAAGSAVSSASSARFARFAASFAASSAVSSASSARFAASFAASSAIAAAAADAALALSAEIAVEALIKLGAQGARYLHLCDSRS